MYVSIYIQRSEGEHNALEMATFVFFWGWEAFKSSVQKYLPFNQRLYDRWIRNFTIVTLEICWLSVYPTKHLTG